MTVEAARASSATVPAWWLVPFATTAWVNACDDRTTSETDLKESDALALTWATGP